MKRYAYFVLFLLTYAFEAVGNIAGLIWRDIQKYHKNFFVDIVDKAQTETRYRLEWGWNDMRTFSNQPCYNVHFVNMQKIEDRAEDWFDDTVIRHENKRNKDIAVKALSKMEGWAKTRGQEHGKLQDVDFDFAEMRHKAKEF